MIKVTPVKKAGTPGYPDRYDISRDSSVLLTRPMRWRSRTMSAALAALIPFAAAGCSAENTGAQVLPTGTPEPEPEPTAYVPVKTAVPFFEHGEGYGSFGCVSIVPPAFITEAEASELFNQIALEYGLTFLGGRDIQIKKVETSLYPYDGVQAVKTVNGKMKFQLDGFNEDLNLAYEFISVDDIKALETQSESVYSSVDTYAVKDTAALLLNEINDAKAAPNTAVFYDPCLSYTDVAPEEEIDEMEFEEYTERAKQINMDELEKQIRGFFEWLKGEGII